jgi:hypothetical protein
VLLQVVFWKYIAPKAGRAVGKAMGSMVEGVAEGIGNYQPPLFNQVDRARNEGRVIPVDSDLMSEAHRRFYDYRQRDGKIEPTGEVTSAGAHLRADDAV